MKYSILFFVLVSLMSCATPKGKIMEATNHVMDFYVGTYTSKDSEGIYSYTLSPEGILSKKGLVTKADNPSYLAFNTKKTALLAVDEKAQGTVTSYKIIPSGLEYQGTSSSGGDYPCFVLVDDDDLVYVANYGTGNLGLLSLGSFGKLSPLLDLQQHEGKGVDDRQDAPHAHSLGKISDTIVTADLGANALWFSKVGDNGKKLIFNSQRKLKMQEGAGPRHMVFPPNRPWFYVLNELDNTIVQVIKKGGTFSTGQKLDILPEDFNDASTAADMHISPDGKFMYASTRGYDSIVIIRLAEDGSMSRLGAEHVQGQGPRSFKLSPGGNFLVVANQLTDNLVAFRRDGQTGMLTYTSKVDAPTPVCILFK